MHSAASIAIKFPTRAAALTALVSLAATGIAGASSHNFVAPLSYTRHVAMSAKAIKPNALSFKRIDDAADPTFNQLLGIDDQGVISGYFGSGASGHPNKGYTIAPPYTTFTADNLPGSSQTQATGITPAAITSGFWTPTNFGFSSAGAPLDASYGFIRYSVNGVTTWLSVNDPLEAPSNPSAGSVQTDQVLGINSSLNAVGFYNDAAGNSHGFVYSIKTGLFSHPFVDTNAVSHQITGINNNNVISGFFLDTSGHTKGFLQLLSNANVNVHYEAPGSTFTQFFGVNATNEAVGDYVDAGGTMHGLVYNAGSKVLATIDVPGATSTTITSINANHQAVGFFTDIAGNTHGVLVSNVP